MTLGLTTFSLVIHLALAVVIVAPVILIVLWWRDRRRGDLW